MLQQQRTSPPPPPPEPATDQPPPLEPAADQSPTPRRQNHIRHRWPPTPSPRLNSKVATVPAAKSFARQLEQAASKLGPYVNPAEDRGPRVAYPGIVGTTATTETAVGTATAVGNSTALSTATAVDTTAAAIGTTRCDDSISNCPATPLPEQHEVKSL